MKPMTDSLKHELYQLLFKIESYLAIAETKRNFPDISQLKNPFFIVGIPGSLCEVEICLKFLPEDQDVVFVANGLDKWELEWAKRNLHVDAFVIINRTVLRHGSVLDLLFEEYREPFGIMDYDCFVFDSTLFSRLTSIKEDTLLNATYGQMNRKLNLDIPETFIMFFNTPIISQIRKTYSVDSNLTYYSQLSDKVKQKLREIGIDRAHQPEDFKNYFDTAKLWISLGLAEGYRIGLIDRQYTLTNDFEKVFHVGAGNKTDRLNSIWNVRGTYFWRRALETCRDKELQKRYYEKYGSLKSEDIPTLVPEFYEQIGKAFFEAVEKIVKYE